MRPQWGDMKKTEVLRVRMTTAQHEATRKLAGQQDWTVSEWVRAVLLATAQVNWNPTESLLAVLTDRPVERVSTREAGSVVRASSTRSSVPGAKGREKRT
jgi:hypothetical protein